MDQYSHIPLAETTRGNTIESIHYGSAAIVFSGEKTCIFGDREHSFFLRSSAKPFQALAFIEHGGAEEFDLSSGEIAIICSSHSGTDEQVQILKALQKKIGIKEEHLQCGTHPPMHTETAMRMQRNKESHHPNRHTCSGKHTGMLAFAKMLGAPLDSYLDQSHPVQKTILKTFAEMCGIDKKEVRLGVDGCSAPVFALPLAPAAIAYAKLCQPNDLKTKRTTACQLITSSLIANPELVAGPGRFDSVLMKTANGRVISKIGAEGFHGLGVMPNDESRFSSGIGITVKISDGDLTLRAGSIACLAILEKLGIFSSTELSNLQQFNSRTIQNWRGNDIGEIRTTEHLLYELENLQL